MSEDLAEKPRPVKIVLASEGKAEYMSTDTTQLNPTGVFRHVLNLKLNSTGNLIARQLS
jgi:hypothetical protein